MRCPPSKDLGAPKFPRLSSRSSALWCCCPCSESRLPSKHSEFSERASRSSVFSGVSSPLSFRFFFPPPPRRSRWSRILLTRRSPRCSPSREDSDAEASLPSSRKSENLRGLFSSSGEDSTQESAAGGDANPVAAHRSPPRGGTPTRSRRTGVRRGRSPRRTAGDELFESMGWSFLCDRVLLSGAP